MHRKYRLQKTKSVFSEDNGTGQSGILLRCSNQISRQCIPLLLTCLIILLVACSGLPTVESHDNLTDYLELENEPVLSAAPTLSPATPLPIPSISPTPVLLVFPGEIFRHPQGVFELSLPKGWTLVRANDGDVEFHNPGKGISFQILITNVGLVLDQASFRRFVDAQEVNFFSAYADYVEIGRHFGQDDSTALVEKHLTFNAKYQLIASLYQQSEESILNLNIWSTSTFSKENIAEFKLFFDNIHLFPENISAQPVYQWVYEFQSNNGLYFGRVPLQWVREHSNTENTLVERFVSPDLQAVVQLTQYDDGNKISIGDASYMALMLLRDEYDPDLTIIESIPLPEGGELLSWTTSGGDISGATLFEIKDSALIIITRSCPTEKAYLYQDILQQIFESIQPINS